MGSCESSYSPRTVEYRSYSDDKEKLTKSLENFMSVLDKLEPKEICDFINGKYKLNLSLPKIEKIKGYKYVEDENPHLKHAGKNYNFILKKDGKYELKFILYFDYVQYFKVKDSILDEDCVKLFKLQLFGGYNDSYMLFEKENEKCKITSPIETARYTGKIDRFTKILNITSNMIALERFMEEFKNSK